ncbi:major facilitator superfamily transporter [Lichtheimia corymbifera JMRC:FSU:9682]|uniref:Lysosomal dipeptide transporter MFSD1 n=1 Tax=Lichtheimia corymbifera JMRC:FSU:9682 TaxID=1263082 RepID=A0A068SGU8_9FUNG|nr:major facilitator superfamily transporter [Lichtheimia corymbifera JMRC:FSU:9682]
MSSSSSNHNAMANQQPDSENSNTVATTTTNEKQLQPPASPQQPQPTDIDSIHADLFPRHDMTASSEDPGSAFYSKATGTATTTQGAEESEFVKATWRLKLTIVMCMLALPIGCHYLEATVGTLKTALKHNMNINNTQFSILVSAVNLVNTILPMLAGFFIDDLRSLGSIRGTSLVSIIVFLGSVLVSIGSTKSSYPIMVVGQVVYGLASGMIVTMQEGILSRWFRDRQIAIIIGVHLCVARLTKFIAKLVCYPIVTSSGSSSTPLYVAMLLCAMGVITNGIYWIVMVRNGWATSNGKEIAQPKQKYENRSVMGSMAVVNSHHQPYNSDVISQVTGTRAAAANRLKSKYSLKLLLFLPSTFWMVPWMQLIFSSVLSSFEDVATEFVEFRYSTTSVMAGYQSSLTQVVPIVAAPVMGLVVHRFGKRLTNLFVAAIVLVVSMVLLAYTWVVPAVGMILISLSLALGPVSILTSTSMLLPHELSGTGMALHKCANNIGTTIVSVIVGYVQDLTYHDGNSADNARDLQNEYDGVLVCYLVMAGCATLVVGIFWLMDRKILDGWLQADKFERERRLQAAKHEQEEEERAYRYPYYAVAPAEQEERRDKALQRIGSLLRKNKSYVYIGFYTFWFIVSWAVFFTFALMPLYQNYQSKFA